MNTTSLLSALLLASGLAVGCGDSEPEPAVSDVPAEPAPAIETDADTYNESVAGVADAVPDADAEVETSTDTTPDRAADAAASGSVTGEGDAYGEAALMPDEVLYRSDEYITNWDALPAEDVDGLAQPELDK